MSSRLTESDEAAAKWRLEGFPSATPAGGWIAPLLEEAAAVQQSVVRGVWPEVLTRSARCLGFGYAVLRWIEGETIAARKRTERLRQTHQILGESLQALARSEGAEPLLTRLSEGIQARNRDERVETAIQALREKVSHRGLPDKAFSRLRKQLGRHQADSSAVRNALKLLAEGKTSGLRALDAIDREGEAPSTRLIHEAAIACLSRGLMAWVHAEFNLAIQLNQAEAGALIQGVAQDVIQEVTARRVDEFAAQLRAGQLALYGALASDRSASEVTLLSSALAGSVEARLPAFAHLQAKLDAVIKGLREQGKGGASEALGRLAVRAGTLTREALATHAACYRIAAELSSGAPHAEVADLQKKAASIPFEADLPAGRKVALGKLDTVEEGGFVEIEGFAQALKAGRNPDKKLITQIGLLDPSSGARAQAVVVFVDLPHAGVTIDSYCRLNGIFRKRSKLLNGDPAIEVDRLSITKLKGQSWWVGFLQLADPWIPYWRNSTHLYWSLGPHEGFETSDTCKWGAAEILFLPLLRSSRGGK